jgi:hypothetical protein
MERDEAAAVRPTWALIDEAVQRGEHAEAYANTVAGRRQGGDRMLAQQAARAFARGVRLMRGVEREEEPGG